MDEKRDWRACQDAVQAFQTCIGSKKAAEK